MSVEITKLKTIQEMLEREGFHTSWQNPFWIWLHPQHQSKVLRNEVNDTLYISNFHLRLTPFDLATVTIRIDGGIHFQLSFYYLNLLEEQTEAHVINEIFARHGESWHVEWVNRLQPLAEKFALQWDIEYDAYIEDSLFGYLKSEKTAVDLMLSLRDFMEEMGAPAY
jgi:hypothetical protein